MCIKETKMNTPIAGSVKGDYSEGKTADKQPPLDSKNKTQLGERESGSPSAAGTSPSPSNNAFAEYNVLSLVTSLLEEVMYNQMKMSNITRSMGAENIKFETAAACGQAHALRESGEAQAMAAIVSGSGQIAGGAVGVCSAGYAFKGSAFREGELNDAMEERRSLDELTNNNRAEVKIHDTEPEGGVNPKADGTSSETESSAAASREETKSLEKATASETKQTKMDDKQAAEHAKIRENLEKTIAGGLKSGQKEDTRAETQAREEARKLTRFGRLFGAKELRNARDRKAVKEAQIEAGKTARQDDFKENQKNYNNLSADDQKKLKEGAIQERKNVIDKKVQEITGARNKMEQAAVAVGNSAPMLLGGSGTAASGAFQAKTSEEQAAAALLETNSKALDGTINSLDQKAGQLNQAASETAQNIRSVNDANTGAVKG